MKEIPAQYKDVRSNIMPGDLIAFSGNGIISGIIRWATGSTISHVGVVIKTEMYKNNTGKIFYNIIEATSLDGFSGVVSTRISDRLKSYDGSIWCLRLKKDIREKFNQVAFFNFLFSARGRSYDYIGAIRSGKNILKRMGVSNPENYDSLFCSELVAGGYKAAGLFNDNVNPSTINPQKLCEAAIFETEIYRLKGISTANSNKFNTDTSYLN